MTTEKILTDLMVSDLAWEYATGITEVRAIEQAVLQSPEIRSMIEALRWAVDNPDDSAYWIHQAKTALATIDGKTCKTCEGHGTIMCLRDNSPDAENIEIECPDCDLLHKGTK